ncbi:unnamed protein product [Victoria cruziana]
MLAALSRPINSSSLSPSAVCPCSQDPSHSDNTERERGREGENLRKAWKTRSRRRTNEGVDNGRKGGRSRKSRRGSIERFSVCEVISKNILVGCVEDYPVCWSGEK